MAETTILQHWIFADFLFPFFLVFFLTFAILERTGVLGKEKSKLNAWISIIIALIFVGGVYPKLVVGKLTLFLAVALVAIFVLFLIWGFISGASENPFKISGWMKYVIEGVAAIAFFGALLWATGWHTNVISFFNSPEGISQEIISNVFIVGIIVAVLVVVLKTPKKSN